MAGSDGNRPLAFFARAADPRGIGVVVIPAKIGLVPFYKTLTVRLAEVGIDAVALDLYGRTAGDEPRDERFDFETHYEVVRQSGARDQVDSDVKAAVDYLTTSEGDGVGSVFTLGFCFGGSVSWWQSAVEPRLSGCIGLYGAPRYVHDFVPQMRAPLLLLSAGDDDFIPDVEIRAFHEELLEAGVPFEAKTYPGAPHSFFDRRYEEHADAARDAWESALRFMDRYSA